MYGTRHRIWRVSTTVHVSTRYTCSQAVAIHAGNMSVLASKGCGGRRKTDGEMANTSNNTGCWRVHKGSKQHTCIYMFLTCTCGLYRNMYIHVFNMYIHVFNMYMWVIQEHVYTCTYMQTYMDIHVQCI